MQPAFNIIVKEKLLLPSLSDGFFEYLDGFKHLNLSLSYIRTLPKSISLLKKLTALILRCCLKLQNVPSLAELTTLERLDLYQTCVSQLPKGSESLIKLRYLNLFKTRIERIGVGVISNLTAFLYFAIEAKFDVKELNSLNNLEHLSVVFVNFVSFSTFIEQMKIKGRPNSDRFVLGNFEHWDLINLTRSIWSEKQIYLSKAKSPTRGKEIPHLNQYNHLQRIIFNMDRLWYSLLKSWGNLKRRPETERRVKLFRENEVQKVLQDIQLLDIDCDADLMSLGDFVFDTECNLQRQTKIGMPKPFSNLKVLGLYNCSNLKKLFPLELFSNLQNVEEISVYFCEGLEELIECARDETKLAGVGHSKKLSIPKLRLIRMKDLPNLLSLCYNDKVIRAPFLRWIEIKTCLKLKRMPFDVDSQRRPFPHLRHWEEEKDWVKSLE